MLRASTMVRESEAPIVVLFNRLVAPLVVVASLFVAEQVYWGDFQREYQALSAVAFLVASQTFAALNLLRLGQRDHLGIDLRKLITAWVIVMGILLFLGYAMKVSDLFSRRVLLTWTMVTPIALFVLQIVFRWFILRTKLRGQVRRVVIVGAGDLGFDLSKRIVHHQALLPMHLSGFFDDRDADRLAMPLRFRLTGSLDELPQFVREHRINSIYITLPMAAQPRTLKLIDELRDTTASIFFVPDIGRFSMVQTHLDEVGGMPVIGVSESPFKGIDALVKRAFDFTAALILIVLLSPLMLAIGAAITLTSRGPIVFKQRRYGLDGKEIVVYKFRSMTVCDDDGAIRQATKYDQRVTSLGRVMRKTSLDELPQLINVLQGRMSLVGPRPHAVAHNEMYRKLIKGYMLRHKVKPGMTGWAQIHGFRGETETVDKMEARVKYDIDYIRNWSAYMDIRIMFRTISLVYRDSRAH